MLQRNLECFCMSRLIVLLLTPALLLLSSDCLSNFHRFSLEMKIIFPAHNMNQSLMCLRTAVCAQHKSGQSEKSHLKSTRSRKESTKRFPHFWREHEQEKSNFLYPNLRIWCLMKYWIVVQYCLRVSMCNFYRDKSEENSRRLKNVSNSLLARWGVENWKAGRRHGMIEHKINIKTDFYKVFLLLT